MTFDDFYDAVRAIASHATQDQVRQAISGKEAFLTRHLVESVAERLGQGTGLSVSTPSTAPAPRPRPTSLIAPFPSTQPQTLATGKPAPVNKSKLATQAQANAPVVAQLKQRVSASQSAVVGQAVGAIQQLRTNQEELQDAVAQELALLMSPQAFMDGVMLKTGQIISEQSAIDVDDLLSGVFDGAREQLALMPEQTIDTTSLEAWLQQSDRQGQEQVRQLVEGEL